MKQKTKSEPYRIQSWLGISVTSRICCIRNLYISMNNDRNMIQAKHFHSVISEHPSDPFVVVKMNAFLLFALFEIIFRFFVVCVLKFRHSRDRNEWRTMEMSYHCSQC